MSILIKTVRVRGFRGLKNVEVELEKTTVLTGMNNTGKTSLLKAMQLALGSRQFISQEDYFIQDNNVSEKIIIDLLIVPISADGSRCEEFLESWEEIFTTERIRLDLNEHSIIPLRTIITFDKIKNSFQTKQFILQDWPKYNQEGINWFDNDNGSEKGFRFGEVPFFYMDAQRDILEDTKLRNSYLGKMLSKIEYSDKVIEDIEDQIKKLNDKAVNGSEILTNIKTTLEELDTAMGTGSEGIEITPFTKKIRDLNKGLTIHYTDQTDSFTMEYHGMGTRSWSSLLTLKAFVSLLANNAANKQLMFFPVIAIEEPEAHLHPNAQKKLYGQIDAIVGQKIISTHSPYIAATAELGQIRNLYKDDVVICGQVDVGALENEDVRKINRQVINTRGEVFFSKMIVFFEGETEEQALPVLAQKHFNKTSVEMGLDFVGVGGHKSYLPFLRFAEALNIPWVIFSDGEGPIVTSVKAQFVKCGTKKLESDCVVFLENGNDFEKQLISDGFVNEIKKAIASFDVYDNEQHRAAKEPSRLVEIEDYDDGKLYEIITNSKTQYSPAIAEQIIQSGKALPPKPMELFGKIATTLKM
ncbi:MAG: AAA family ATPase [Nitrosopumilus sp.]|nr:AAA family ATPase [Nitrosopumilus sp.]